MQPASVLEQLKKRFGESITGSNLEAVDPWIEVAPAVLPEVCLVLRDEPEMRFAMLQCVSGVDYFEPDAKKAAKVDWQPHVEVLYHLLSLVHKSRIVIKVRLPRWKDDVAGTPPEVPTVSHLFSTANWHEREVFDLTGVHFTGHPDLRRILCPEDWVGFPLRKDYQMPVEYHGIRVR